MINPEKLTFKRFITTVGNLPSSYVESLSYYECIMWLCNYLQNTVIPAVNNNAEALEELQGLFVKLQEYVDNYFENLDVQEEINNKLDELVEDGTLETLLNNYNLYYKNVTLIGNFYQKLIKKGELVINCQGDSLTYGQDNNSSDKRSPDSTPCDDGTPHTNYRASVTYPEELQNIFDSMFGSNVVTVNNLGHSGDSAKTSYAHWTTNRNADLALIMLGTNDSKQSDWLPVDYRNNISEYLNYMGLIIEQYLNWNTAVILLTPPYGRTQNSNFINGNTTTNVYDDVLKQFAKKYNCPVVEVDKDIVNNYNDDFYSDDTHYNGVGYKSLADKLFAIFCGTGILNSNFNISTETLIDSSIYNTYLNGVNSVLLKAAASNNITGNNKIITINNNGKVTYGFNCKYDNILVIPIATAGGTYKADFESTQPSSSIKRTNNGVPYNNVISNMTEDYARTPARLISSIVNAVGNGNYLLLPSKGYHTISVENTSGSSVYLNGFYIMPLEEASKYVNKIVFSLLNTSLIDNEYRIPLRVLALLYWTNVNLNSTDGGRYSITPVLNFDINSGGGLQCYKLPLDLIGRDLPIPSASLPVINGVISNDLLKYYDVDYTDTTHGIKSTLASLEIDENDLIVTFDDYNEGNTSIAIS